MLTIDPYLRTLKVAAMLILLLIACSLTHKCTASHYQVQIAGMERSQAQERAATEAWARHQEQALAAAIADIDSKGRQALQERQREIDRMRAADAAGRLRLRVAATCPDMPAASASAGVDHGASPELDAVARPHYLALRDGIGTVTEQLTACQALLTTERQLSSNP